MNKAKINNIFGDRRDASMVVNCKVFGRERRETDSRKMAKSFGPGFKNYSLVS